ncbi:hypothetical protein [Flavobacterium sp.]|jgi:hypothetical protein|uniref:hypothetical protein n=1 Tax=Flavobacterium sp. TaxID=239 RepID=UPI0037BF76AB
MATKLGFLILICFSIVSCDITDYQILKLDTKDKIIYIESSDYVIDSISLEKNETELFSISLKEKSGGENVINLYSIDTKYRIYKNYDFTKCDELVGIVFIRKKGFEGAITKNVISQRKNYKEIQQFFISVSPCSDSIVTFNALRRLK